jgi:serine protease AprX
VPNTPQRSLSSVRPPPAPPPSGVPGIRPLQARLDTDERFTGRGVTIAFIDSGFYAHPDLVRPENRILAHHDLLTGVTRAGTTPEPDESSWHGMMTSVVCAGNGALSGGRYRGLASEADLVLVKAGTVRRISHLHIRDALEWILGQRERLGIRVVNISCGGDYEASYLSDPVCGAAEALSRAGVVVVAAVGNAARDRRVLPPANAPSVISVGGLDDAHQAEPGHLGLYESAYGPTVDGLQKPEIIAPAIWVAASILPETPTAARAQLLDALCRAQTEEEKRQLLAKHRGVDPDLDAAAEKDLYLVESLVDIKRRDEKIISEHYKHVDGTSFAAPIVSSVVAQLLQANPGLSPNQVKKILIDTAARLPNVATDRQGWGVVRPAQAVAIALDRRT